MTVILLFHLPANNVNMGTFLAPYVYDLIIDYIQYFIDLGITLLQMLETTTLLIPLVEFLATWALLPEYRNQVINSYF